MKSKTLVRIMTLVLALSLCMVSAIPAFAATSAVAPLTSLTVSTGYALSPKFQQNTQVYTIKGTSVPVDKAAADAIVTPVIEGGTVETGYDVKTQMMTITTSKDGKASTYYISFVTDTVAGAATNVADINVKKVLQADSTAKVDSLTFNYELIPVKVVANTANQGVTTIPLAATKADDDTVAGTVTVTGGTDKSTMEMTDWEAATPTVSEADATTMGKTELKGKKVQDGVFSVTYDEVGQYVYLLHEIPGDVTGVTYDASYYEVTVSVVHKDPNDPKSDPVIGWIEVKAVTEFNGVTNYTAGDKVNFGTTTAIDGTKYDNVTTSITYPYINVLATEDLVINKTVTGDLGDADQEFLFELTVKGTGLAEKYVVSYTNTATGAKPLELSTNGSEGTVLFTLKHGVTATVAELPVGATYTLTELVADKNTTLATAAEAANYNTTITYDKSLTSGNANADDNGNVVQQVDVAKAVTDQPILDTKKGVTDDKNYATVVNDKPLTPPTGAFVDMLPYIAIAVVAVGGIVTFAVVRRRRNAYED